MSIACITLAEIGLCRTACQKLSERVTDAESTKGGSSGRCPFFLSPDDGADVGADPGTPVTNAYDPWDNRFNGTIHKVTVEVQPSDRDRAEGSADAQRAAALTRWLLD